MSDTEQISWVCKECGIGNDIAECIRCGTLSNLERVTWKECPRCYKETYDTIDFKKQDVCRECSEPFKMECYTCGDDVTVDGYISGEWEVEEDLHMYLLGYLGLIHCVGGKESFIAGVPITCNKCYNDGIEGYNRIKKEIKLRDDVEEFKEKYLNKLKDLGRVERFEDVDVKLLGIQRIIDEQMKDLEILSKREKELNKDGHKKD
jgi:hypothetical protein